MNVFRYLIDLKLHGRDLPKELPEFLKVPKTENEESKDQERDSAAA